MEAVLLSIIAYISTNVDDLFINMIFFAQAQRPAEARSVVAGKYLGMDVLIIVSLLGAWGLQAIPTRWLSLLGFVPVALGIREIIRNLRTSQEEPGSPAVSGMIWLSMMLTTIASGADNIGVYMPLFAGFRLWQMLIAVVIFQLMTGLWCLVSKRMTDLPSLRSALVRCKPVVIPVVYILLGLYILL